MRVSLALQVFLSVWAKAIWIMPSLNSKSKNMYNRCLINVHINKASSEATSDSKELSLFGSNCVNTSLCCGKKKPLDHYQGLSCAPVPPQWASGSHTRKELRVDQYTPAETHTQACTNTHDLTLNALLKQHRGSLYVSFIIKETLDYRPLSLFSLFYAQHKSYSGDNADISAKWCCTKMSFCLYLVDSQSKQDFCFVCASSHQQQLFTSLQNQQ